MTNQEAITKLTNILNDDTYSWHPAHAEALSMAVEALKVSEVKRDLSDMISRQAAIDMILGQPPEPHYPSWYAEQIKNLPSTQPEPCEDVVSREKVFEYFVSLWECIGAIIDRDEWEDVCKTTANELPSAQPSFPQRHENGHIAEGSKMDCISRQEAIDFIAAGHFCNPNEPRWSDNEVVNFLKSRPSAQPEIVRCKDCTRFDKKRGCNLVEGLNIAKADSFCSYAERREG